MNKRLHTLIFTLLSMCVCAVAQETELEQDLFETMHEGDKAAIVAVHVGADDLVARERIDRFNERFRHLYPEYTFREAWTSRSLIRQMSSNGVSYIPTPDELFSQLKKDGYTHILIQSSNIVNCAEMQFLRYAVETAKSQFKQIRLGEPLLNDEADYEEVAKATAAAYGNEKEANVLMCSSRVGTENAQYAMLDYTLRDNNFKGWFVGIAGGYPSIDSILKQLKTQKVKKVHLIPFLFAASNQTTTDMIREWTQHLQRAGYKVTAEMHCLGDVDAIMDIFERHIKHAEKYHRYSAKELKLITR